MELEGKQPRLLKDLEAIEAHGGRLTARREQGDQDPYYRLEGWKGTQSDPLDLDYTIGASFLDELREGGYIQLEPAGGSEYSLASRRAVRPPSGSGAGNDERGAECRASERRKMDKGDRTMPQDSQGEVGPGTQVVREVIGDGEDAIREYLLYRPRKNAGAAPWPVLLFLHGRGEGRSKNGVHQGIIAVTRHGAPPWRCQEADWNYPFIIVSPQLPRYLSRWHEPIHVRAVEGILDNVVGSYEGDVSRVYATGFSIGGLGAVAIAAQGARLFAALLPVDSYDPEPSWNRAVSNSDRIGIPLWSHHSAGNTAALGIAGVVNQTPRQPVSYDLEHVKVCRAAYADPNVFNWLLDQTRS